MQNEPVWSDYPNFSPLEFQCSHTGQVLMRADFLRLLQQLRTYQDNPWIRANLGKIARTYSSVRWYVVKPAEFSQELTSGLQLPDIAKGKSWYGLVIASPPEGPNLDGKMVWFNRTAGMEYMREPDDRGRPNEKAQPYVSIMAVAIHSWWHADDVEHALNAPAMAIDHDAEKDNKRRILGG